MQKPIYLRIDPEKLAVFAYFVSNLPQCFSSGSNLLLPSSDSLRLRLRVRLSRRPQALPRTLASRKCGCLRNEIMNTYVTKMWM